MKTRLLFSTLAFLAMSLFAKADPLPTGAPAPSVTATTDAGESLTLSDVYAKHAYTLVYFYPKADTPGCTAQGCSLRDSYEALTKQGVAVIGVSTDTVEKQKAFKEKYHLPFTLLADHDKKVIEAFGVPTRKVPVVGEFASRQAFLVKEGRIVWADYTASTEQQAADVLKFISGK